MDVGGGSVRRSLCAQREIGWNSARSSTRRSSATVDVRGESRPSELEVVPGLPLFGTARAESLRVNGSQ